MARKGQAERSENARVRVAVARRIEEVGRMRDCPDRMGELERRLRRDGIELARSKGGSLQYRFPSKSLGGMRKVNGGRLGFAVDRSTGIAVRFTLRGIATAMRAFWELERRALENQNGRTTASGPGRNRRPGPFFCPSVRATSERFAVPPQAGKMIPCNGIHISACTERAGCPRQREPGQVSAG